MRAHGWSLRAAVHAALPWIAVASIALAARDVGAAGGAADCLSSSGKTACGFHCVASDGQVRCAQTVQGVCSTGSGIVACWDPPAILKRVSPPVAAPSCLTSNGQTACGYDCMARYDHVLCAQTPFGACHANEGTVVCWDPAAALIALHGAKSQKAECVSRFGTIACGYHCMDGDGQLRCAETWDGTCRRQGGAVVCWDPPLDTTGVVIDPASELACFEADVGRKCGFHCLATTKQAMCGQARRDSCHLKGSDIVCQAH